MLSSLRDWRWGSTCAMLRWSQLALAPMSVSLKRGRTRQEGMEEKRWRRENVVIA